MRSRLPSRMGATTSSCDQPGGGLDDADVLAFGENHPFRMPAELIEEVADDVVAGLGLCGKIGHGDSLVLAACGRV